ncbi:hypothetical protein A3Q56_02886 [Intoshia linei]|uniref:Mediator of RNA polymerase II transcription subunit 4 n=1 Tax=Intoshia linei TaxID=1819745 RepID=A0A177B5H2_9BILA|nr:hypothetical protein A3Q56_02886 [Intoshia linei]
MNSSNLYDETEHYLRGLMNKYKIPKPSVLIICGNGLRHITDNLHFIFELDYDNIPNFPKTTVEGHMAEIQYVGFSIQGRIRYHRGVLTMINGPTYPTVAEAKFLKMIGGDMEGMITCPEHIVAHNCAIKNFGLSLIAAHVVDKYDSNDHVNHKGVLETTEKYSKIISNVVSKTKESGGYKIEHLTNFLAYSNKNLEQNIRNLQKQEELTQKLENVNSIIEKYDSVIKVYLNEMKTAETILSETLGQLEDLLIPINKHCNTDIEVNDIMAYSEFLSNFSSSFMPSDWKFGDSRRPYPTNEDVRKGVLIDFEKMDINDSERLKSYYEHRSDTSKLTDPKKLNLVTTELFINFEKENLNNLSLSTPQITEKPNEIKKCLTMTELSEWVKEESTHYDENVQSSCYNYDD